MSNKYPQYFTNSGLERRKKRPSDVSTTKKKTVHVQTAPEKAEELSPLDEPTQKVELPAQKPTKMQKSNEQKELIVVTTPAKKIDRKKKMVRRVNEENRSISPAAAKAIAEALKSMLHS